MADAVRAGVTGQPMIGWLDASAGVAGDMLLGALLDAGADLEVVRNAVSAIDARLTVTVEETSRHGISASKATVINTDTGQAADVSPPVPAVDHGHGHRDRHSHDHERGHGDRHSHDHERGHGDRHSHDHERSHGDRHSHDHEREDDGGPGEGTRTWRDVRALIEAAGLSASVTSKALGVFSRLADAEGSVHGIAADEVHFHEVGALDAIGDVVGCAAALDHLSLDQLFCSTITLGDGDQVLGEHGRIPIPGPAVLQLVAQAGAPTVGGPVRMEMTTPTGAALVAEFCVSGGFGAMPAMTVMQVGVGAGSRDPQKLANVLRIVIGTPAADQLGQVVTETPQTIPTIVLEANIDDLDARLWPDVLTRLMQAGASDAWLTPILMKKGRPAYTLSVLCRAALRSSIVTVLAEETSTIGMRERAVAKIELDRVMSSVEISGQRIAIKVARLEGRVVNAQPEYVDVVAAAAELNLPIKIILAKAIAAAAHLYD